MFRQIMMGTALVAAVAAFNPSAAFAQGGHGGGRGGGGAHFGGGGGARMGGAHFGGGNFSRGGGGFNGFAARGGMMRNSFASTNPGVMRNAMVNRSFGNNARVSQNMQYHRWNNGGGGHRHGGWWRHRGWGYGTGGLALGYGLYNGYYDDPYAYYGDGYYDNYAYNDDDCYRVQRYYRGGVWRTRTVNVCQ